MINAVGGSDYFEPGDVDIKFINKLNDTHYIKNTETTFDLAQKVAKSVGHNEYDWEAEKSEESTVTTLKDDVNMDVMNIYMVTIEYTKIQEI